MAGPTAKKCAKPPVRSPARDVAESPTGSGGSVPSLNFSVVNNSQYIVLFVDL